jgi:hypothetical protein
MSNFPFQVDPKGMNPRQPPIGLAKAVLFVSALPFAGFGIFMIWKILHIANGKNLEVAIGFILFVLLLCSLWFAMFFSAFKKLKQIEAAAGGAPARAEKPWLARPDWAAGKIKSSAGADVTGYLILGLAFGGMGGVCAFFVLPQELQAGNYKDLAILIFPAIGAFSLLCALRGWRGNRRFGESLFVMASVPGAPGGALEGTIQTGAPFRPKKGVRLRLSCVHRMTGDRDRMRCEKILWQDEKTLKNEAVAAQADHASIPVYFPLPAGQPECFEHGEEAIVWRLEAKAKMSGPDFNAMFAVPVFNLAGAAAAQAAEPGPAAALPMPIEEIRRDEHSKIQIRNAPDGREFFFPAARNPGAALGATAFLLIWSAFLWVLIAFKTPVFAILFGLVDVLVFCLCFNLWFKQSRVTINSKNIRAAKRWLLFGRTRLFDTRDAARFDSKAGMTSGRQVFHDIQLITRAEKRITVATGLASQPETAWLVREMNKTLKA